MGGTKAIHCKDHVYVKPLRKTGKDKKESSVMPYTIPSGVIACLFRRNDNPSQKVYDGKRYVGWRDGFGSGYIDPDEWGSPVVLSDFTLRRCSVIILQKSLKPVVQSLSEGAFDANGNILPTGFAVDYLELQSMGLKDVDGNKANIIGDVAAHKLSMPIDGLSLSGSIFKDISTLTFGVHGSGASDDLVISSGSYTVGSDVGDDYPTFGGAGGAYADIANLTGDITLTLNSDITETAYAPLTVNLNSNTLSVTSNSQHNGDPTSGHTISINIALTYMGMQQEGPGSVYISGLKLERITGTSVLAKDIEVSAVATSHSYVISNCMFKGYPGGDSGIALSDNDNSLPVNFVNCVIWGKGTGIRKLLTANAGAVYENISIYNCGVGVNLNSESPTCRNIVALNCTTADYQNISAATGRYNIDSDGSAANGNWNSGVGNGTATTVSAWQSVDDTNSAFLDIVESGPLDGNGESNTISRPTCIRGRTVPGPNGTSIGAAEFEATGVTITHTTSQTSVTPGAHTILVNVNVSHTASQAVVSSGSHTILTAVSITHTLSQAASVAGTNTVSIGLAVSKIGSWDAVGCIFAALPSCWENGESPSDSTSFPVYIGDAGSTGAIVTANGNATYTDGYLSIPDTSSWFEAGAFSYNLQNLESFTVEAWVTFDSSSGAAPTYFSVGDSSTDDILCLRSEVGPPIVHGMQLTLHSSGTTNLWRTDNPYLVADDTKAYVAIVKNKSAVSIYVNGELASLRIDQSYTVADVALSIYRIGQDSVESGTFIGRIHSLIMYDKALTASQISTQYGLGDDLGGLLGYDNGDGTMRLSPAKSVRTRIREAVVYGCEQITSSNGYQTTLTDVNEIEKSPEQFVNLTSGQPAVNVVFEQERYNPEGHSLGRLTKHLPIRFDVYVRDINDVREQEMKVLADIEKYFANNECIPDSNKNATVSGWSVIAGNEVAGMFEDQPFGRVSVRLDIWYHQHLLDPSSTAMATGIAPSYNSAAPTSISISKRDVLQKAIKTTFQNIDGTLAYNNKLLAKHINNTPKSFENQPEYPFVNIIPNNEFVQNSVDNGLTNRYTNKEARYTIDFWCRGVNDSLLEREEALADIERVLLNNPTLPDSDGRRTCIECIPEWNEFYGMEVNRAIIGLVRVAVKVWYVQDILDPAGITADS